MKLNSVIMLLCLGCGGAMTAAAQDPAKIWLREGPYRLLDTPEIMEQMNIARKLAGDDHHYLTMQRLQCRDIDENGTIDQTPGSNVLPANPRNPTGWAEVPAVPTQVFDNVYYVGGMEVGGWLIDTGDGYIMLDSSYDYGTETILLPGMAALGLDPANIKYILITHAGPDHIGGAKYFQDKYGTKIIYDASLKSPFGGSKSSPEATIVQDGATLTLGDTTITMVTTPRSVGGSGLSYFIPVSINGKPHLWATFGNTGLTGTLEDKAVYRKSMAKFFEYVDELGADIAISSHPFVDASIGRMETIRNCNDQISSQQYEHKPYGNHRKSRQQCAKNPFLMGKKSARRYFEILDQCAVVQIKRQEAGLDANGLKYLP